MRYISKIIEGFKSFLKAPNWPKFLALIVLGLPPGLIFTFILSTLQFWLNSYNLSKIMIGMFSLAILPNALKFIWAPFLEIINFPILSRYLPNRYAWSVALCVILCFHLIFISYQSPGKDVGFVFFLVVVMSTLTASLEINLDAIRIELFPKNQQGYASSFYAFGYRLGQIIGAFGVLYVSAYFSWQIAFFFVVSILAFLSFFLVICAASFYPKPLVEKKKRENNFLKIPPKEQFLIALNRFKEPFLTFINSKHWFSVFFFIFAFRLGDSFINNMSNIFYLDIGFSQLDIANVVKFFGVFFTILGTFIGGYLVMKYNDINALLISGFIHILSNFMYLIQSYVGYDFTLFYGAVAFENITAGMATTAFVAYLSNLCKKPYTGSHYALFSSIWYLNTACAGIGGILASYLSWSTFFIVCIIIGFASLSFIFYLKKFIIQFEK